MKRGNTREFSRGERIGTELLRELTLILRRGVKDPRLGDITLHEVRVTRDLAHAQVFFTCFPLDADHAAQQKLLNGSLAGFLRSELAKTTRLRTVPELHFVHDESIARGEHLSALIEQAVAGDQAGDRAEDQAGDQAAPVDDAGDPRL